MTHLNNSPHLFPPKVEHWYYVLDQEQGDIGKVAGPVESWQDACLMAYGHIAVTQLVKFITNNRYWIEKRRHWVLDKIKEPKDFFNPYIEGNLEITTDKSIALGPPEISKVMSNIGKLMLAATSLEELADPYEDAQEYLRFLSTCGRLDICEAFSKLYNQRRESLTCSDPKTLS